MHIHIYKIIKYLLLSKISYNLIFLWLSQTLYSSDVFAQSGIPTLNINLGDGDGPDNVVPI